MKSFGAAIGIAALLAVSACGGGGDGANAPSAANAAPVPNAGSAQSVVIGNPVLLDGSASHDPNGDAITYTWSFAARPAGSSAQLIGANTARPTFTPDRAGAYTLELVVNDGNASGAPAAVTITAEQVQIVVDKPEPLSGTVGLSLAGTVTGAVTWFIDLQLLGTATSAGSGISWSTTSVANGTHLVTAQIRTSANNVEEVRRTVSVMNSSISLSASVSGTSGTINVDVRAASSFGITSVSASLDGVDAGTLTSTNACSASCTSANPTDVFRFVVDAAAVGSGEHLMVITAVDGSSTSRQISVAVPVSNAPALQIAGPMDGAFVHGTLQVTGTASSDKPGPVTVTALLRDVQFLQTTASSFSGSFDLTGLPPGGYVLTVRATDSANMVTQIRRGIIVASSGALAYAPALTFTGNWELLAAEGDKVLYRTADGAVQISDLVVGSTVNLADVPMLEAHHWRISGGRVDTSGKGSDCTRFRCVYQWQGDGSVTNLSANPASGDGSHNDPVARDGYVLWAMDQGTGYTLYNANAGTYRHIASHPSASRAGNNTYDLAVINGAVHFFYWGTTAGDAMSSVFDVFQWRSDTGNSIRLTQDGMRSIYPQTDGVRVAWERSAVGSHTGPFTLMVMPVTGGTPTILANNVHRMTLEDGVLAWSELTATGSAIKAATLSATTTLSTTSLSSWIVANREGQVVYYQGSQTYSWNSATGTTTLRMDSSAGRAFISGGSLVFQSGSGLYRVPLN